MRSLRRRFSGPVVAGMLCRLQVHVERSLRTKGMLIARAAGVELEVENEIRAEAVPPPVPVPFDIEQDGNERRHR